MEEQEFEVCSVKGRGPSVIRNEILIQRKQRCWTLKYREIFIPGIQEGQVYLLKQSRGQNGLKIVPSEVTSHKNTGVCIKHLS